MKTFLPEFFFRIGIIFSCLAIVPFTLLAQNIKSCPDVVQSEKSHGCSNKTPEQKTHEQEISKIMIEQNTVDLKNFLEEKKSMQFKKNNNPVPFAACNDMGGENGWGAWTADTGSQRPPVWSGTSFSPFASKFNLTSGAGIDPCTPGPNPGDPPIQLVAPGFGNASIQIGGWPQWDDCRVQRLRYSLTVTQQDTDFVYAYALVIEEPGHTGNQEPYVSLCIYDQNNVPVPCGCFTYDAKNMPLPGFYQTTCPTSTTAPIWYKPWTIVGVDLSPYVGQTLTIEIINSDCTQCGSFCSSCGHFAHSYWDFLCGVLNIPMTGACGFGQQTTLCAPNDPLISYTYQWYQNGNPYTGPPNATAQCITPIVQQGDTFVVQVSQPSACNFDIVYVPQPTIITLSLSSTSSCGSNGTASVTASGGTLPYTYLWNNAGTTSAITGLPPGNYSVTVTDVNGCTSTATVAVTAGTPPSAAITGGSLICVGQSATLTASGGGTYVWNTGATSSTITVTPAVTTTYSVTATGTNGCTATATATVTVSPPPVAFSTNATICSGQNATLTASGGGNYSWSNGSTANPLIVSPTSTSSYSVIVSIGSCSDTANATVTVNPNPTATAWSNVTITQGQSATLSASGGGTYLWNNGMTDSVIIVSPNLTTVFCVTVTDANGCTDSECVTVLVEPIQCPGYSDDELFVPDAFSPNTDTKNDFLRVYYPIIDCIREFNFIIYDRWGEKVFESSNIAAAWDGTYKGKTMNTAVFVYYLKVTFITGEETVRKGNVSLIR